MDDIDVQTLTKQGLFAMTLTALHNPAILHQPWPHVSSTDG